MARVFVCHDQTGKTLSVASVRVMSDALPHPFQLADATHGVVEVSPDDPAFADGLERAHETHVIDVAQRTLVAAPQAGSPKRGRKRTP